MDTDEKNATEFGTTSFTMTMTHQQSEVYELLRGFATERTNLHEWYQGALQTINSTSADKIAQAANSIREICDRLPDIADIPRFKNPISAAKSFGSQFLEVKRVSYSNGWQGKPIERPLNDILQRLEKIFGEPSRTGRLARALTNTDPQADFLPGDWRKDREKSFEALVGFFQNVTHHSHFAKETEFFEKLNHFESLLINFLTPCTADQQKELLALMAGPATPVTFTRIHELTSHKAANYTFFFERLENPDWLPILDQRGYFANLPDPEPTTGGKIIFRHHLPLTVLTRLAGSAPKAVTDILIKLQLPDNPNVGDQVFQCLAKLRDAACIERLQPLISQLCESSGRTSWLWIEELLKSWVELKVYTAIFAVLKGYLGRAIELSFMQPSGDTNIWLTKQVDEKFLSPLAAQFPLAIANLLFEALRQWAHTERRKYQPNELSDEAPFCYLIEDFKTPPPMHRGVEGTLAIRLFAAADQVYRREDSTQIDVIDRLLRSDPWQLFRRLRWQLYADFPCLSLERARAEVLQRVPLLNDIDYGRGSHDYEFAQLLVAHARVHGDTFLSKDEVKRFVAVVLTGPIDKNGEFIKECRDFFVPKQLWPIASLLRGAECDTFRNLVPDESKMEIQSYKPHRFTGGSGGDILFVAPPEAGSLEVMSDEQLWMFLNTWTPTTNFHTTEHRVQQDIFALGTKFGELLEKQRERFNPSTKWWENIERAEILNKLLELAAQRVSKKRSAEEGPHVVPSEGDWSTWLGISQWIMKHSWQRYAVVRFIDNLLESELALPDSYCSELPGLLSQLIEEPDARLEGNRNSFNDWLTTAINSNRGQAIEATLNLASRQKRDGGDIAPWIFELLRSRLEYAEESPAIFALLGSKLRFLIHLFKQQFTELPSLLFPSKRPECRSAAIIAHFNYDRPWNEIIVTFPDFINVALNTLEGLRANPQGDEEQQHQRDFGSHLGTHIACYYWSNSFANDAIGENALDKFFSVASKVTRAMVINQIAHIWTKPLEGADNPQTIARVMRIWERRFAQIERRISKDDTSLSEYDSELAEATGLLHCECFSFEWRFSHTKSAIGFLKKAPRAHRLLNVIAEFGSTPDRLGPMLELLSALLRRPSDDLRWAIQYKDIEPVISSGLASDIPTIQKLAKECKDLLLKMGFSAFLNLAQ